jgi:hypothetical protein
MSCSFLSGVGIRSPATNANTTKAELERQRLDGERFLWYSMHRESVGNGPVLVD